VSSRDALPDRAARHCRSHASTCEKKRTRAPSGRSFELKSRSPGVRVRRFLSFASRFFAGPVGFLSHLGAQALKGRTGRIAGRTGNSAPCLLHVRRSLPRAGLGLPPFAKASRGFGWVDLSRGRRSPPALSEPLPEAPRVGGDGGRIRGVGGTGDNYFARELYIRRERTSVPPFARSQSSR
jgi:hypothetical protein